MATKPKTLSLSTEGTTAERTSKILNTVRANSSQNFQNAVPMADGTVEALKTIGNTIMQYPALQNEFLSALVNRIGRVILTSRMFSNPWSMFKKGYLEFGETVEEIFTNLARPHEFDQAVAEKEVFKREIPDVRAAFHIMNYTKFYKATISNDQLRQAFLSFEGIERLIASIVDALYTGANYDEFITMKYLLAIHLLKGEMYASEVPAANKANAEDVIINIKGISNMLEFPSAMYNQAGVMNAAPKNRQYLIINAKFDAIMDVAVLASAFNMSKAEFLGHRVLVDSFANLDVPRLQELFADNPNFYIPTQEELEALDNIPAVLVDEDYFMVFDNLDQFTENYNGQGLYWNYFYHVWKTFSVSPFSNAIAFVQGAPAVTSVTVSPATATLTKGGMLTFKAEVETESFAPESVVWSVDSDVSTIDSNGVLKVSKDETLSSLTVTATSVFDSTKSGTATVTVE